MYTFPPSDLLHKLVHLYFDRVNIFMPLMHRPTFERSLKRSEHLSNHNFGMTVLLVCAIGARYSHDPRVTLPGDEIGLSSGWQYYNQVQLWRPGLLRVTTIYDLQYYSVSNSLDAAIFLDDNHLACNMVSPGDIHGSHCLDHPRSRDATVD